MMGSMKSRSNIFVEYLGWCGALAIVASYTLYFLGKLGAESIWFQLLNLLGALALMVYSLYRQVWPVTIVCAVWGGIAVYSLYVYLL
jgi:hypothetical protein